ncbi:hypothetical protein J4211_05820 [Candidatus Woesearchaeota archaeon]|nr:hypothetical protein [Candidatus Woesearchaeota archaeon]
MKEIEEARHWLNGAEDLLNNNDASNSKYTVIVAMCVHSIIRANDALTNRFLFETAKAHEDAPRLFLKLIENGKIDKGYKNLAHEIIAPAIRIKSLVDYRGATITQPTAATWLENTKRFLNMVKEILK